MKNLKDDFMNDEWHNRLIEGIFLICLNNDTNFLANTVWRMKTYNRGHFRFTVPEGGEKRIEPDRIEAIIEINS